MQHSPLDSVPMPKRIAALPRDPLRGYPVPFFVAQIDGQYDFRIADEQKRIRCIQERLCWICGQPFGRYLSFVIGPMCAVNRISADPPMHRECAEYSVKVCPFLLNPAQRRNPKKIPEGFDKDVPGVMIPRNPGVQLLWTTTAYKLVPDQKGYLLFGVGPISALHWYAQGRDATRAEVMDSFESGLAILRQIAKADGLLAERALEKAIIDAVKLLPVE
jgi:hypothetical protein